MMLVGCWSAGGGGSLLIQGLHGDVHVALRVQEELGQQLGDVLRTGNSPWTLVLTPAL